MNERKKPAGKDTKRRSDKPAKTGENKHRGSDKGKGFGKGFDKGRKFGKDKPGSERPDERTTSRPSRQKDHDENPSEKRTNAWPGKKIEIRTEGKPEKRSGRKPYRASEGRPDSRPGRRPERTAEGRQERRPVRRSEKMPDRSFESYDDSGESQFDAGYPRSQEPIESTTLFIKGRHEVLNALESKEKVEAVYISSSVKGPVPAKLRELASQAGIPVKELKPDLFERKFGEKSQGIAAIAGAFAYSDLGVLIDKALAGNQVLVALNQIEDARNLGAIVRTVEASGCSGVIIQKHRSVGMTEWAIRTAQGAAAHLPVARVTNLGDSIKLLKDKGFWVIGLDEDSAKKFTEVVYSGPIVLVAGGEDAGLGDRVRKSCDDLVSIPLRGKTTSLNVSVSTAVVLYEICRQKDFFSKT